MDQLNDVLRVVAVGDLMLGDSAIATGYGFRSRYQGSRRIRVTQQLKQILPEADLTFGNLECVLSTPGWSSRHWRAAQMRSDEIWARDLRESGLNVMSVANNHAMQHGTKLFERTAEVLEANGIAVTGLAGSDGWRCRPCSLTVRQHRVGILAYCLRPRQYPGGALYAEATPDEIREDVARLKEESDFVIVSLHWGEEFVDTPSEREVELARSLISAGTSLLIGHHPHVPRPVEVVAGGVIAYSLGNIVSDMVWMEELRRGIVLEAEVRRTGCAARVRHTRIGDDYLPVVTSVHDVPVESESVCVEGLQSDEYSRRVARELNRQRIASYRYAARNLHRFRFPTQIQLAMTTLRNKLTLSPR